MRILIVEDEPALAFRLQQALEAAGFAVDTAYDGENGWHLGDTEPYDAAVLDLGLPKLDGISVLSRWREAGRDLPVLILTARGRWSEKMQGFNAGADDYVTKPFEMDEIVYRLRALIRRASGHSQPELACGPVRLDTNGGRVSLDGQVLQLTAQEFRILSYLMHHPGKVVSRTELMEHVYDRNFDSDSNVLEVMIGRLRKKIGAEMIQTVRGQGYVLSAPEAP
ncbi:response regulator transcription factor [Magnetospirillum gryphiswaldense]|uniref:Two-component transcriptional regulator FeuP, winged helix family n=1 Tax=Magnetospirillum gryphiswaldense TaxID=55518 RepID=A4TZD5_9PROT|nr:response regulator transcription factor [Magnetospirillum gryphiswaldense]AVM74632.1 Transcriptional regulatory protein PhoP [Magnetospirillum gryphiswaldense MSR-1]AVM78535.1 Transcriptional regulatory protein PhoP [Magnetospirillum gryphiswaldense]CAM75992.1 two-component transcriptional regulator FeuP, winged helix family [Magnetospirillum gryphiswaldense MSR-1]